MILLSSLDSLLEENENALLCAAILHRSDGKSESIFISTTWRVTALSGPRDDAEGKRS